MTISTGSGVRLYIGGVNNNRESDLADYVADSYIEIGEVEDGGEFGDESEVVTFTSLADGRVRKLKGARDAGTMQIVVGDDTTDEGQQALEAAEAEPHDYNLKVVLNDAITLGGSGSTHYFTGKVMSKRRTGIQSNSVVRRQFTIGINSAITEVAPT